MRKVIISLFLFLIGSSIFAQTTIDSPWVFEAGFNVVDVYPVGKDAPQGAYRNNFV